MSESIKGYKGFNNKLQCTPNGTCFQYELGKEFETDKAKVCEEGFHFCENPFDVLNFYEPVESRYCEVEGSGDIDKEYNNSKVSCTKIKIGAEIGLTGLITAGVKFILDKVDWSNNKEFNTGYRSAATNTGNSSAATNTGDSSVATNTGYMSAATNTGYSSAATNTGYRSVATNTGYRSAATNTGNRSVATNTGDSSVATNTGYMSAATNTGYSSAATNTGYRSVATNTGNRSVATNTGYRSVATNTGNRSAATVEGKDSIACGLGIKNKAKGALGCWIVLTEWYKDDNCYWYIKEVKAARVDGEIIKEDKFYMLVNGEFKEVD